MCVMLIRFPIPKCQMHAYTRFENGCSENSTQKLLTKYSTEENNKHVIASLGRSVLGKTVPSVLGTAIGLRPPASGCTQDLWHSFSQYGPPGRQITYIYRSIDCFFPSIGHSGICSCESLLFLLSACQQVALHMYSKWWQFELHPRSINTRE